MKCVHWSSRKSNAKTGSWQWTRPNIISMLDTNISRTQTHVHASMSKGLMPLLPCVKNKTKQSKEDEKFFLCVIFVIILSGIQHAFQYYIIEQTVKPDGEVQLQVRCLCSSSDKTYDLRWKPIFLLRPKYGYEPIFFPLPTKKLTCCFTSCVTTGFGKKLHPNSNFKAAN